MSDAVRRVTPDSDPEPIRDYWTDLGRCLPALAREDVRRFFPDIFRLGCLLEDDERVDEEPPELWWTLFGPLSEEERPRSLETFVAAAESLFVTPDWQLQTVPQAERIAAIHRFPSVRDWLYGPRIIVDYTTELVVSLMMRAPRPAEMDAER